METLNFETEINASPETVWRILWGETYPEWTKYFSGDSTLKSDWKIGGKTYFLDSKGDGMISTISSLEEPYEVVFRHLGLVKDHKELLKTMEVEQWSGMEEKYFLSIRENKTHLKIVLHTPNEYHDAMCEGFKKGLEVVKNLAEQS